MISLTEISGTQSDTETHDVYSALEYSVLVSGALFHKEYGHFKWLSLIYTYRSRKSVGLIQREVLPGQMILYW